MAKNRYICDKCLKEEFRYSNAEAHSCDCRGNLVKQMPRLADHAQVTEVVDKYRNIKHKQDQKEILEKRRSKNYWQNEVPKLVRSGTYCEQTMFEQGWIYRNEKGEICIRTTPPKED